MKHYLIISMVIMAVLTACEDDSGVNQVMIEPVDSVQTFKVQYKIETVAHFSDVLFTVDGQDTLHNIFFLYEPSVTLEVDSCKWDTTFYSESGFNAYLRLVHNSEEGYQSKGIVKILVDDKVVAEDNVDGMNYLDERYNETLYLNYQLPYEVRD